MLPWEFFRHYLLSRRAGATIRTVAWLCMGGVAIGVLSLVVVISVMNGFNDSIQKRLLAVEPHLVVTVPGVNRAEGLSASPIHQWLLGQPEVQTEIFEKQDVIIRTVDGLFGGAVAQGSAPDSLGYILRETRKATSKAHQMGAAGIETAPIMEESSHLGPGEVMMGIDLARGLGIFEGDKIVVIAPEALLLPAGEAPPFERVTVKALLSTNNPDVDSKVMFYGRGRTFTSFRDSLSREAGFEIRLKDPNNFSGIRGQIEAQGAKVESWVERNSSLFFSLRMEKLAMSAFLGLSALIASSSIVTVLVLLLTQKKKDIGLLMALGLSPLATRNLFVKVGLLLSVIGIGTGLVGGIAVCLVISRYPLPILPEIYYDATIPATIEPLFVMGILIVATIVAVLSAWIPARSTTQLSPADALNPKTADR